MSRSMLTLDPSVNEWTRNKSAIFKLSIPLTKEYKVLGRLNPAKFLKKSRTSLPIPTLCLIFVVGAAYGNSDETFGNELGLFLPCLGRLGLLQQLPAAGAAASARFELAHVLPVAFELLLLGIDAARFQRRGSNQGWLETQTRNKSLAAEEWNWLE